MTWYLYQLEFDHNFIIQIIVKTIADKFWTFENEFAHCERGVKNCCDGEGGGLKSHSLSSVPLAMYVKITAGYLIEHLTFEKCVCVCVCERERERECVLPQS